MVVCEKRECLVGVNKTFGDHFAGIGNMVIMKSQFVTSPDDICFKRTEFDTFNQKFGLFAKKWSLGKRYGSKKWTVKKLSKN